jgi:HK97 family phage major capsid protein
MPSKLETLRERQGQISGSMQAIAAAAENESRAFTPEEQEQFDTFDEEFKATESEIGRLERLEQIKNKVQAPQPRLTEPMDMTAAPTPGAMHITGGEHASRNYQNRGFTKGPGEFLLAVRGAMMRGGRTDPRLMVDAITTFGGEGVAGDGGFALPPQFMGNIMDAVIPEDSFLRALNPVPTNSNVLVVPVNENPSWGTSGITSAKTAEGAAITPTKPAMKEVRITLYKAASLVHLSDEMLSDIPFISGWVMQQMGNHLNYQLENWVMNGTGEAEPLGILNSPALISLADVDSDATHIGQGQILTMESCLLRGAGGAFFVASPTVYPAIGTMTTGTGGYPLIQPDMTQPSRQALLGRPFYRSEACPILNVAGDLTLVQPNGYVFALKGGGVQTATTIGFAFDQDLQSFRATLRAGGGGLLSAKVERAKSAGSTFASHFVTNVGSKS